MSRSPDGTTRSTRPRAVIFDMDGVVVDSERYWQALEAEEILPAAVAGDPPAPSSITGMSHLEIYDHLAADHEMSIDEAAFVDRYEAAAETVYGERVQLMAGFAGMLADLRDRGLVVALASSSPHHWIDLVTGRFDLGDAFDAVVSGEDVPAAKPDPAIYEHTAQILGVDPADCVAVEDSGHGVAAARAAGMAVVGFQPNADTDQDLGEATAVVDSPAGLRDALLGMVPE